MSATLSVVNDQVVVRVKGALKFDIWQTLRDGREAAHLAALPLCIDIHECNDADMAGIGSVLLAQKKLSGVTFCGCHDIFISSFRAFGICQHCAQEKQLPLGCSKRQAN